MIIRRFYDEQLAQACYLIGCQRTGEAIVIDPPREFSEVIAGAAKEKLRITRVTESHIHADFCSGAYELAQKTGAQLLLSGEGGTEWRYQLAERGEAAELHDGDEITLGGVRLTVRHTPGHTPEHIVFIVTDTARSEDPVGMVSGDFLFVGDVGRPDLLERAAGQSGTMETGARQLFNSIRKLADLPDYLQIWPGHGAGSACGKALGAMASSTLGYERRTNWALGVDDESTFIAAVLEGQPAPPKYFAMMKKLNREGPPILGTRPPLPLVGASVIAGLIGMSPVIDIRPTRLYRTSHILGALHNPLANAFATWAGWLVPYDRPIHLIAETQANADEARRRLAAIGLDNVVGYADASGFTEIAFPDRIRTSALGDILASPQYLASGRSVIDVRNDNEWNAGHIPGATHHTLGHLPDTIEALDRNTPIALHCQGGGRSAIGASVLESMGFTDVIDLPAGVRGWNG